MPNAKVNTDRLAGTFVGSAGTILVCAIGLMIFWPRDVGETVKPTAKGDHVIVFVDDSAPSIPQGIILDGPQFDALKLAGMCSIVPITDPIVEANNYGPLLEACGGSPGMAILTKTGDLVKATRLPTDQRAVDQLLAKHVANLPPPLPVPAEKPIVNRGGKLETFVDPNGTPAVKDGDTFRRLAAIPSQPAMRAGLPRYGASNPIFPEREWRPVNRRNVFGSPDWILNQGEISSCVGNGWAGACRRARVLAGMEDVKLSPGFVYSLINHNQDRGAIISDGINALLKIGTCTYATVGQKPFYQKQMPAEAKKEAERFRLVDCFQCDTWEETCSALQTGRYTITFGVMVGNNWTHFDKYGVCGHDRGPGNHCVAADGMVKVNGKWVLDGYNSWGYDFGPWKNGRMYLDREHLFGPGVMPDVCAIRQPARDPLDKFAPPKYRHKAGDAQLGLAI